MTEKGMRLRLSVPESIAKAAIRSNLHDSPAGARMHEALLRPEEQVQRGFTAPARYIRAEPEAWEALLLWLQAKARTEYGDPHSVVQMAARCRRMERRLTKDLDKLAAHPGYRGLAVMAIDTVVLPARQKVGDVRWWPSVRMALASPHGDDDTVLVAELRPACTKVRGSTYTIWEPLVTSELSTSTSSAPAARRAARRRGSP